MFLSTALFQIAESCQPYSPAEHEVGLLAEAGEVVAEEEGVVDLGAGERVHELLAVGPDFLKLICVGKKMYPRLRELAPESSDT